MAKLTGVPHVIPHRIHINGNDAAQIQARIRGATGQTANIFEVQTVAGATLFSVDNDGDVSITGNLDAVVNETLTGNITLAGNLTVNGNTTLGDAGTDTLTVAAASSFSGTVNFTNTLVSTSNGTFSGFVSSTVLNLPRRGAAPATMGSTGRIYTFAGDADTTELWYRDAAGNDVQITDAGALEAASLFWDDDEYIRMGNVAATPDVRMGWNTTQTVDAWYFGTADGQNTMIIAENGDRAFDFAHGVETNPTLFIHSAAASTTQFIELRHTGTQGEIETGVGTLALQQRTVTPGAALNSVTIAPTYGAEGFSHTGLNVLPTQNGANATELRGINITLTKATGATVLSDAIALRIGPPSVTGTVTNGYGIFIEDQSTAGGTISYGINIASQTANATTTRAINIAGTGVNNAIELGDSPLIYSSGVEVIRFDDSTAARGISFTLTAAGNQTIAATAGGLTLNNNRVGIGIAAGANSDVLIGASANDVAGYRMSVGYTDTSTTGTIRALNSEMTANPGAASDASYQSVSINTYTSVGLAQNLTGSLVGGAYFVENRLNAANTLTLAVGSSAGFTNTTGITTTAHGYRSIIVVTAGTVTNGAGFFVRPPTNAGTLVNMYGLDVSDVSLAGGTTAFGIRIQSQSANAATTRAIEIVGTGVNNAIRLGATVNLYANAANQLTVDTFNTTVFTQSVVTSGSPTGFTFTGGAHTTLAASTEATDVFLNLTRTVQFATGALTTQRAMIIGQPTYGFVAASTLSTAITAEVAGPPRAGTNATITNSYGLVVGRGSSVNPVDTASVAMLSVNMPDIANSVGAMTNLIGFELNSNAAQLGNQTATLDWFAGMHLLGVTLTSNTLVRTVADAGTLIVAGPPVASTNVTITNPARAVDIGGGAITTGTAQELRVRTGAHTGMTLSTEVPGVNFDLVATKQWATGALVTQRELVIAAPIYGFVGASTVTNASTVDINRPPRAGTNATITTAVALNLGGGGMDVNATNATQIGIFPLAIRDGYGAMTTLAGLYYTDGGLGIPLGDQTATLTNLNAIRLDAITYTSTTLVRTVTNPATLYIGGAPVASTNVTFSNTGLALHVDGGTSRFDGALAIDNDGTITLGSSTRYHLVDVEFGAENFEQVGWQLDVSQAGANSNGAVGLVIQMGRSGAGTTADMSGIRINAPTFGGTLTDASAIRIASQSNFANGDAIRLVGTGTANAITFATAGRLYANAGNTAIVVTGDLDAGGTRIFNGGIQANSQTLAANTNLTLDENDSQVLVTLGSTSDNTITLPAASGNEGMIIHVYVTDGAGTNNAVVTRAGVDTIANGSADLANTTITLQDTGDFVMLMCVNNAGTGDEWSIAAQSGVTVA